MGLRLGVRVNCEGQLCQHRDGEGLTCGSELDAKGVHATVCKKGPFITAAHHALADMFVRLGRQAGFAALREQVVPQLQQQRGNTTRDAVLDVELCGHASAPNLLLDVTLRQPCSQTMRREAAKTPEAATSRAEAEKRRRYPPAAGVEVT
jgi:hypothetical protein